ncbi:MAG: dTMP kinase [Anaerolineales bacterium]|nr:dTMP kinase [Anaerolineales bacterium]
MFITLEGPEGSGKTEQLELLADELKQRGCPLVKTREPGGTPIGDQIRSTILDVKNTAMVDRTEALLLQASRAQLVEEVIKPHLAAGEVVICDRYADSTLAYQGYGHQNDLAVLREIIRYATGGLQPDLTVLLDIDPVVGLKRRTAAGKLNRLDALDIQFHRRVRAGYLELAGRDPERWKVIDAERTREEVHRDLLELVLGYVEEKNKQP